MLNKLAKKNECTGTVSGYGMFKVKAVFHLKTLLTKFGCVSHLKCMSQNEVELRIRNDSSRGTDRH